MKILGEEEKSTLKILLAQQRLLYLLAAVVISREATLGLALRVHRINLQFPMAELLDLKYILQDRIVGHSFRLITEAQVPSYR